MTENNNKLHVVDSEVSKSEAPPKTELFEGGRKATSTRKDLQMGRRFFHAANGVAVAGAYALLFTHARAIHLLGTVACVIYLIEQVRINYPKLFKKASWFMNFFLRAEEQMKESSMIPYVMAILLSIITFPKTIALISIFTLALADPLSAIVGIHYGKHHIVKEKSVEGSAAFFCTTLMICFTIFSLTPVSSLWPVFWVSILVALFATAFEMLPIRLDDNLTIPLFVGFCTWPLALIFGLPL